MSHDGRQPVSRPILFLQAVALVLGLESVDKAIEMIGQYFDQAANGTKTPVARSYDTVGKKVSVPGRILGNGQVESRRKSDPAEDRGPVPSTIVTDDHNR